MSKQHLFSNKKNNLVYGKHLKELIKRGVAMKKLFCNVPSYIHRVKYKKVVEHLYKTVISDDKFENQTVLKTLANVAFGLLEKSYKRKIGFLIILRRQYSTGKKYDGRIYAMNKEEYEEYFKKIYRS